jgi:biotin operon repressor
MPVKKISKRSGSKTRVIKALPTAKDRVNKPKLWNDSSLLRRLYTEEGKSQGEIAKQLGCSIVTVNKAFKKAGVKVKRGRRSMVKFAKHGDKVAAAPKRAKSSAASTNLMGENVRDRINELADIMDRLGTNAKAAVRQDLHELVDRL